MGFVKGHDDSMPRASPLPCLKVHTDFSVMPLVFRTVFCLCGAWRENGILCAWRSVRLTQSTSYPAPGLHLVIQNQSFVCDAWRVTAVYEVCVHFKSDRRVNAFYEVCVHFKSNIVEKLSQ